MLNLQAVQVWATLLIGLVNASSGQNRTVGGRVFSLFSIVQFPNSACSSTSNSFSNGTCYTSGECSSRGGSASGNCASGFGVCCVFSISASGSRVSQNNTYIVNPNFPSNYAPTTTPNTVSYTISKSSSDICRIRLDYESFVLTQPLTALATQGQCSTEFMTLTTTDRNIIPSAGVYGDYPYLCGTNTGYHSYLDLSCTSTDTATLSFTLSDATLNQWKIKVTQLSCDDPYVANQEGCFQYHTGVTGTLNSYNFAGGAQLTGQNYKNCIRQEEGYCCIEYSVISYSLGPDTITCISGAAVTDAEKLPARCTGATTCTSEYILVPGVEAANAAVNTYDRFCGLNLNSEGFPAVNAPIRSCDCPFELSHITGITSIAGTLVASLLEDGFSLSYSQIAGSC